MNHKQVAIWGLILLIGIELLFTVACIFNGRWIDAGDSGTLIVVLALILHSVKRINEPVPPNNS